MGGRQDRGLFTRHVEAWAASRPTSTTLGRKGSRLWFSSAFRRLPFMMIEARNSAGWFSVVKMWKMWTMERMCLKSPRSKPPCWLKWLPILGGKWFSVQKNRIALAIAMTMFSAPPPGMRTQPRVREHNSKLSLQARKRSKSFPFLSSLTRQSVVSLRHLAAPNLQQAFGKTPVH